MAVGTANPLLARELHYMAKRPTPVFGRMLDKFTVGDGCWVWTGSKTEGGYGKVLTFRSVRVAHRVLYELLVGPVPDGYELDHLCRNRACVNPGHLEPVTHAVNVQRGAHVTGICPAGHELTPENTYVYSYGRFCKVCQKARIKARSQQRREHSRGMVGL